MACNGENGHKGALRHHSSRIDQWLELGPARILSWKQILCMYLCDRVRLVGKQLWH